MGKSSSKRQILEKLATAVVMADPADTGSMSQILDLFVQLNDGWGKKDEAIGTIASKSIAELKALIGGTSPHRPTSFNAVCSSVSSLQAAVRNKDRRSDSDGDSDGPAEEPAAQAKVEAPPPAIPAKSGEKLIPLEEPVAPAAAVAPPPPAEAQGPKTVHRDAETLELHGDFLQESDAGLDQADEILMAVEAEGLNPEKINALFRVFHSIKGVAGFLELTDVTALAHITETLLNSVRDGELKLEGTALEVVFESTAMSRNLLTAVRRAVETSTEIQSVPGLHALIGRIDTAIKTGTAPSAEEPASAPAPAPAPVAAAKSAPAPAASKPAPSPQAAEPAEASSEPEESSGTSAPSGEQSNKLRETVKVDLERVDQMVEMIGELIIVESMVVHAPEITSVSSLRLRRHLSQLSKISRDLQDIGMRMRMVPVKGVFQKMARLVRELSRKTGKKVSLAVSGETTEMDRSMVERIEDPLVHMIRNSCDHGIESPDERIKAGKRPEATVRLSAYHEGGSIVIEISDDGRGLHKEKILKKAITQKLIHEGENLSENEIHNLIFMPGFSTASQVTEISGRGVGMDVVKRNVEAMRGRVTIASTFGSGTTFRLMLPLTLAIIDGMLVACGQERYILPSLSIVESLKPTKAMISTFAQKDELLNVRGEMLPLLRLSRLFNVADAQIDATQALAVVVEGMGKKFAFLVDDVVTQQQVVIKPLSAGLENTEYYSGAAILSDGKVGLILNIDRISSLIKRSGSSSQRFSQEKVA